MTDLLLYLGYSIVALSLGGILLVFLLYPIAVWVVSLCRTIREDPSLPSEYSVSLIVVARNAEKLIAEKIHNSLTLDYPKDRLQIILFSDGSTDTTEQIMRSHGGQAVKVFSSEHHQGKAAALNQAVQRCCGEIVVFSDADALLNSDAVCKLAGHYADPEVGGVCGQIVISKDSAEMKNAQSTYIDFDSAIKALEVRVGSITSNTGKLYSIRKELFRPIDAAVTDDLYTCLSVVRQNRRFVYEPRARAHIPVPARRPSHEVQRRRRIVARSLRGIYLMRELLNPFRYGFFSVGLAVNKILRRLLPIFLLLLFFSCLLLSFHQPMIAALLIVQLGFYGLAISYPVFARQGSHNPAAKPASLAFYFCLGNYGTLLGLIDFLAGKKFTKWDPVKTD